MHYRNGREAKNGDRIMQIGYDGKVVGCGVLVNAVAGQDYCNGQIAATMPPGQGACLVDCLHVDDVEDMLKEQGLDKRPAGK